MASLVEDAYSQIERLFIDNMELRVVVDNMVTEWAVILEGGDVVGIYNNEASAVLDLADFDQRQPNTPAWIVSRHVGPWVKQRQARPEPQPEPEPTETRRFGLTDYEAEMLAAYRDYRRSAAAARSRRRRR